MEFKATHIEDGLYRVRFEDGREVRVTPQEFQAMRSGKAVDEPPQTTAVEDAPMTTVVEEPQENKAVDEPPQTTAVEKPQRKK